MCGLLSTGGGVGVVLTLDVGLGALGVTVAVSDWKVHVLKGHTGSCLWICNIHPLLYQVVMHWTLEAVLETKEPDTLTAFIDS